MRKLNSYDLDFNRKKFAQLLGVDLEEVAVIRKRIRREVIERHLKKSPGLLKKGDPKWKTLWRAVEKLQNEGKQVTIQSLVYVVGRDYYREWCGMAREAPHLFDRKDKTPSTWIRVFHGGLIGVGGKHSRRR